MVFGPGFFPVLRGLHTVLAIAITSYSIGGSD